MNQLKKLLPYLLVIAFGFYLLPLLIRDTGSAMAVLLAVFPLLCFFAALLAGRSYGFYFSIPLLTALLFAPTIWIYYNESAWIYCAIYGAIALLGNAAGLLFFKGKAKNKE